jgi:hypothetical protein
MTKNSTGLRPWTATEIRKLRGLAQKKMDIGKIARALNRSVGATAAKAQTWGGRAMTSSWASFEDKVRAVASAIWNGDCKPQNIGGVAVDGVMILSRDAQILIEITEERELDKVRRDVNKLQTARNAYLAEHQSFPRCFCVVNGTITRSMLEAGEAINISVLSFDQFANIFFNFEKYSQARLAAAFSSAINPLTGAKDEREYVPVSYPRCPFASSSEARSRWFAPPPSTRVSRRAP